MKPAQNFTVNGYVWACIVLAFLTLSAVVAVYALRPDQENTALTTTIIGFSAPLMLALLALMQRENHATMNSRLDELVKVSKAAARAEGVITGEAGRGPGSAEPTGNPADRPRSVPD